MSQHFLRGLLQAPQSAWGLRNVTTGALLATYLVPAFDRASRNRGLLKHAEIPPGEAIVLAPCSSVHTWFMRFAIDIIFVARDGEVLKVRRDVVPWRMAVRLGAFAVIEVRSAGAEGLEPGHRLSLTAGHGDESES